MKDVPQESKPAQVSAGRTKQGRDATLRHVVGVGRNLRWVGIVCWQLGDPSDGGREDLASSSLLSGSPPYGSPGDGRASPLCGEPPTGEPCAGDPHARFGGGRDRVLNRSFLPLSRLGKCFALGKRVVVVVDGQAFETVDATEVD